MVKFLSHLKNKFSIKFKHSRKQMYGVQWLGTDYILACGSEKNCAVIYDRGYLKVNYSAIFLITSTLKLF